MKEEDHNQEEFEIEEKGNENEEIDGEDEEEDEEEEEENFSRATLAKAAVSSAAIEQFYQNLFKSLSERSQRRQTLELKIAKKGFQPEQAEIWRKKLDSQETSFIRMRRLRMTSRSFEKIRTIGKGAFGEVSLVRMRGTEKLYAMKRLNKSEMLKKDQVEHVRAELAVLVDSNKLYNENPWITKLYYSFQDKDSLYLIIEYAPGGDMMTWLIKEDTFSEDTTRHYIAETISAIDSIHKIGYIHRDIKPDNLLLDINGHIKLTDFGLCTGFTSNRISQLWKIIKDENKDLKPSDIVPKSRAQQIETWKKTRKIFAYSTVGTPDYIAPEVFEQSGYGQEADWWSVGCIMFEMLVGYPPFCAETQTETWRKIMNWKESLQFPDDCEISTEAKDLILRLICDSKNRLGSNGTEEFKKHPFFKGVDWEKLRKQKAPFIPVLKSPIDTPYFDVFEDEEDEEDHVVVDPTWKKTLTAEDLPFIGYTYKSFHDMGENFGTMLRN